MCFELKESSEGETFTKVRMEMIEQFFHNLGGKGPCSHNFKVEGCTVIIPLGIGPHMDVLNCALEGMSTVLQVNTRIPMNEKTIPGGRTSLLWKWLELNGYSDWFPCSIILYTRRCVSSYASKCEQMVLFEKKSMLHKCIGWAITSRVNHVTDYIGNIWHNDYFVTDFHSQSKVMSKSMFLGKMLELTPAYNKTVSSIHVHSIF